jgi:hypothetical protein
VNHNGKVYFSGGQNAINKEVSITFHCFNLSTEKVLRLPDMNTPRYGHSMLQYGEYIFAVGGVNNTSTERFELENVKWTKMSNMIDERENAVLVVNNNFLYAFFGQKGGMYLDSVEKMNIKNVKSKWEIVAYKNPEKLDLKMIGCGVYAAGDKEIYMFGGKTIRGTKKEAIKFDFTQNQFSSTPIALEDPTWFHESMLIDLGKNSYGQFHQDSNEHFLKIELE